MHNKILKDNIKSNISYKRVLLQKLRNVFEINEQVFIVLILFVYKNFLSKYMRK
jgi:hypothetical protein